MTIPISLTLGSVALLCLGLLIGGLFGSICQEIRDEKKDKIRIKDLQEALEIECLSHILSLRNHTNMTTVEYCEELEKSRAESKRIIERQEQNERV